MKRWGRLLAGGLLLVLAVVGCSGSKASATIRGKVIYKGTPLAGQSLVLFSEGGPGEFASYRFLIQADGSFAGKLPSPGDYQVAIERSLAVQEGVRAPDATETSVPAKYRTRQGSGIVWPIQPGENQRDFDLMD